MRRLWYLIFSLIPILLIPWLGITWLIFSVYCLLLYFRERGQRFFSGISLPPWLKFLLFSLGFGMLTEVFAIIDNMPRPPEDRILLSPDPLADLYLAIAYYLGFAIVWTVFYSKFSFTHRDIFLLGGTFGILYEQTGNLLFTLQVWTWPYVFLVYGPFQASAAVLADGEFSTLGRRTLGIPLKIILGSTAEVLAVIAAALLHHLFNMPFQ